MGSSLSIRKLLALFLYLGMIMHVDTVPVDPISTKQFFSDQLCRYSDEVTKCVEPPLVFRDGMDWCHFHICAPRYITAVECPKAEKLHEQATHLCELSIQPGPIWKCKDSVLPKETWLPLGCSGSDCTQHTFICACESVNINRYEYEYVDDFSAQCP